MTRQQIEAVLRTLRHMRGVASQQFALAWTDLDQPPPPDAMDWQAVQVAHESAIEMFEAMLEDLGEAEGAT